MRSFTLLVQPAGLNLRIAHRTAGEAQVVLVLPDEVDVVETPPQRSEIPMPLTAVLLPTTRSSQVQPLLTGNGFPPRALTEETIVDVLREHGGSVRIREAGTGWNIYDEIAARLRVSIEARRRLTSSTGEPAWRPEVGYARKNLEQRGIIKPTEHSGRGVWALSDRHLQSG